MRSELINLSSGVNQAIEIESGILKHAADDGHVLFSDELVGHENAPNAMRPGDASLVRGCQRDAPGARLQLHLKELWRHCGLTVGREAEAVGGNKFAHPAEIVLEPTLIENRGRQTEILMQKIPVQLSELF